MDLCKCKFSSCSYSKSYLKFPENLKLARIIFSCTTESTFGHDSTGGWLFQYELKKRRSQKWWAKLFWMRVKWESRSTGRKKREERWVGFEIIIGFFISEFSLLMSISFKASSIVLGFAINSRSFGEAIDRDWIRKKIIITTLTPEESAKVSGVLCIWKR